MSKATVLGLDNMKLGQFDAIFPVMAWNLNGHPNVSGGGSTAVRLVNEDADKEFMRLGRMVVVSPTDLDPYLGIIDTPWSATTPVEVTIYDPEYLLNIRIAEDASIRLNGTIDSIISQMIYRANVFEDLYLRLGTVGDIDRAPREHLIDGRPLWEQLRSLLVNTGTEMKFRVEQGPDQRWYIYVDIAKTLGENTSLVLTDGELGNMQLKSATVKGEIWNRVVGAGTQSTQQSRMRTVPMQDVDSVSEYRMRDRFVQFRDVKDQSTLDINTLNSLNLSKKPYLELVVDVLNVDHAHRSLRLGNRVVAHAQNIRLPGGRHGWRGTTRITKMALVSERIVNMTLVGEL